MKREYQTSPKLDEETKQKVKKELTLGFLNLSEGFFEEAKLNFLVVNSIDVKCPDAFWGMMLAKLKLTNEDMLFSSPMVNRKATEMFECQQALECADEDLKKIYNDLLERIYQINDGENF